MIQVAPAKKAEARHTRETKTALKKMHAQSEEETASRLAKKLGLYYIDLNIIPVNSEDVFLLSKEEAERYSVALFYRSGKNIRVGTTSPRSKDTLAYIKNLESQHGYHVQTYVISPSSLTRTIAQYDMSQFIDIAENMRMQLSGADLENFDKSIGKLIAYKDRIEDISTTELLDIIFAGAIKMDASDIHIEPQKDAIRLRYRIDGVLQDIVNFPATAHKLAIARLKLLGKMKINIRDQAQDGHMEFEAEGKGIDVRISTIPSKLGEGVVMRLLKRESVLVSVDHLGLIGKAYDEVQKNIAKNTGMILTTGPTGSGKTTTLYSLINHINEPETKIITIEDPVEYQIEGISQTEISKNRNYTFAKGLRAIVRQDPDVILVGEIRDDETADVAINAALTGHLVLSTLHTNNAPATVARLLELGVKPTLIPPATNIFMAQRLVRTLCECKEQYTPAEETSNALLQMLSLISPKAKVDVPTAITTLYRPVGCATCRQTGYKGRIGIFEVLSMSDRIEELVMEMAGETEIMKAALEEGFVTMTQDGILKALGGTTTMEEVYRVTSEGHVLEDLYANLMEQTLGRNIFVSSEQQTQTRSNAESTEAMHALVNGAESDNLLPLLLSYGLQLRASDVHIEPQETEVSVRLRIDGVLQEIATIPLSNYPLLLGKIKEISNIPTTVRQGVSDSRFGILRESIEPDAENEKIDVRVSIIIGGYGETSVLRLLSQDNVQLDINALGLNTYNVARLMESAKRPYGVVLNTGPTGSGKTTTLYSVLNSIKAPEVKIITIEDPIEYHLDGILQTQIDRKQDYTFSKALRALLRQDPDIMLVGEIRDEETAQTAINAALTGHLIISTLHTNDAVGAIQRLINLAVRPDDLTTALTALMAQRLVRKLCDCKKPRKATEKESTTIKKALDTLIAPIAKKPTDTTTLYEPTGCQKCNGIGFKGRSVVSEVLVFDDDLRLLVARGALNPEVKAKAVENGMLTMEHDGILQALLGTTTLEEVQRVTVL